ncbi:DExH-box ATP-dependent RNA helicase DExH9 [Selaginella moellendorffii]|uniref:DExH-box ATP-dependent RNA helicase DExH9 n=1 Tax=Selaginella moellendorffii TaxID=88036 RepID=UPI000D1CF82B|nr:DExH-box ATP-dependent RNA helicase DExH9 [Selaginella moellendorffii]|eukprot:XP_024538268.1 DExH-box ATP-dependent RNA helicase DExH9 [Selaginella moellendorffii]
MAAASTKRGAEDDLASPSLKQAKISETLAPAAIERGCIHEIAYPDGFQASGEKRDAPAKPAKEYPFTLDAFQREAIAALEAGESVMVSAHTSAGKTVVAEYAIAMALRDQQRVLYTSPIKALSNQKFRELAEEFSDVGLMTGDVTISPNASCLVMTTEILRSMQYRGSEVMREVAWIIFDEVHYMRDRERGVVWEESIVMAPKNARFVFLSATVPNAKEFADWVAKVHQQPCHIVYTDFRPTPLQHYIFPAGGDGLYLVVDEQGTFREDSFSKAVNAVAIADPKKDGKWQKRKEEGKDEPSDIWKIVKMIIARQYDPVIVFSFSKRDCEHLAMQMSKMDLNSEDEKKLVEGIFRNAMDSLSEDDKKLPQVSLALPYLKRGIGVHHSGLLPILKEVIEILFQEGLVKCLFATETFSIGLNMPAKTVVFTNVRKFDGDKFRWITSGEYIQMSGRAGRRGLDNFGVCIFMLDEKLEPAVAKQIVKGTADPLNSAFHLSYNMILNQMRCEESNPEDLLRQSFHQFQSDRSLPILEQRVKNLEEERASVLIEEEEKLAEYYSSVNQLRKIKNQIREIILAPRSCLPFLQPGRLVRIFRSADAVEQQNSVLMEQDPAVWGVIINFEKAQSKDSDEDDPFESKPRKHLKYVVDVLVNCVTEKEGDRPKVARPVSLDEDGQPLVTAFPLSQVESLSAVRIRIPRDLRPAEAREQTLRTVLEVLKRFPDGLQLLDPEDDMKVESSDYKKLVRRVEALETLIAKHPVAKSPTLNERLRLLQKKEDLAETIRVARKEVRAASALIFKDELKARRRVLRRLSYATRDDVVQLKGLVACEISSADELIVTELIFNGVFKDVTAEQAAALLSCFVWQEKTKMAKPLSQELAGLFSQLQDTARQVGKLQVECKVPVDVEEYVNSFRPDIMEGVHAWCTGKSFLEVLKVAEVFEGSLIRALRRLEELVQQLVTASKAIGEADMEAKFQDASTKMKRDIVFAASLYL